MLKVPTDNLASGFKVLDYPMAVKVKMDADVALASTHCTITIEPMEKDEFDTSCTHALRIGNIRPEHIDRIAYFFKQQLKLKRDSYHSKASFVWIFERGFKLESRQQGVDAFDIIRLSMPDIEQYAQIVDIDDVAEPKYTHAVQFVGVPTKAVMQALVRICVDELGFPPNTHMSVANILVNLNKGRKLVSVQQGLDAIEVIRRTVPEINLYAEIVEIDDEAQQQYTHALQFHRVLTKVVMRELGRICKDVLRLELNTHHKKEAKKRMQQRENSAVAARSAFDDL